MDLILPCAAGISSIFAGGVFIYTKLRFNIPVAVNCWFCNADIKVSYKNKNQFVCSSCQQYNGFTEDGDYNQDIPAQHCESMNSTSRLIDPRSRVSKVKKCNEFCEGCNLNQALKVRALAEYSAVSPDNYDKEVEEFRQRLERMYGLCQQCEAMLHQTLGRQNSWLKPKLIAWRLQQSKDYIIETISQRVPHLPIGLRMIMCILSFTSLLVLASDGSMFKEFVPSNLIILDSLNMGITKSQVNLSVVSTCILFHFVVLRWLGKRRYRVIDIFSCIGWIIILSLLLCKEMIEEEVFEWVQVFSTSSVFLLTLFVANISRATLPVVRDEKSSIRHASSPSTTCGSFDDRDFSINNSFEMNEESVPPLCTAPSELSGKSGKSKFPKTISNDTNKHDLDSTFGDLRLGTPKKVTKTQIPNAFTPRSLFSERPESPSILTPSKLNVRCITQSSWVAGGYWGVSGSPQRGMLNPHNVSSLDQNRQHSAPFGDLPQSRSSSQSSGFISQGAGSSNQLHSGQPSLIGDVDRASVLSESANWGGMTHDQTLNGHYNKSIPSEHPFYSGHRSFSPAGSICSEHSQFAPSHQSTCFFRDNSPSMHQLQHGSVIGNQLTESLLAKYCNPWMAFILGVSISANAFLVLILCKTDIF